MLKEVCHTCPKARPCILLPFLPEHCIPPGWVEVIKVHAIVYVLIPFIPENRSIDLRCHGRVYFIDLSGFIRIYLIEVSSPSPYH
jgi:hypothetical protein